MVSAHGWQPLVAVVLLPTVAPRAASVCLHRSCPGRLGVVQETHRTHALLRLKRRADFLRVAGIRRKWVVPGLLLQAAPIPEEVASLGDSSTQQSSLRLGFTVSRKVGNAVTRNRAKRRLKAAAGLVMPDQAMPGFDYVLIGRRETVNRPFPLLLQDLQTALKRLNLLQPTK